MQNKIHVGIDPGKDGAVVIIGQEILTFVIPCIKDTVDILGLSNLIVSLKEMDCHVVLEDVHSIFGASAKSNFSFGHTNGLIEGILVSHKIPYTKIQPKTWQKEMWTGISEKRKPDKIGKNGKVVKGSIDTKTMSLLAAKRLFPNVNLKKSTLAIKDHDGIVDALLMAEYSRRKFN